MQFSIVTICKNPGLYLVETIKSVLQQDFDNFEYILVDGGSTDGTLEVIRSFASSNPRLSLYSRCDAGISDAMNQGIMHARGDIVAFLHADDRYSSSSVLREVNGAFARSHQTLWVTGGIREIDSEGQTLRELPARCFSYRRLLRNNILFHPATFVRREVFSTVGGFDSRLRYAMDYDLWLRIGSISSPFIVNKTLADFRVHRGSLSSSSRYDALEEDYLVRCRYIRGWVGSIGHACYYSWRRLRCRVDDSSQS